MKIGSGIRAQLRSTLILITLIAIAFSTACQTSKGASGFGDPYHPELGNGGYDVNHYDIMVDIDPIENLVHSEVTIEAVTTQKLRSFNLDFAALKVDSLRVNGSPASHSQKDNEMIVTLNKPLEAATSFTVHVTYHGHPEPTNSYVLDAPVGWFHSSDGSINVLNWPDGTGSWLPGNHHQSDMATYRFDVSVPTHWVVVAPGEEIVVHGNGDKQRFVFEVNVPMTSISAVLYVDDYNVTAIDGPNGTRIRTYVPSDAPESVSHNFHEITTIMEYFASLFGNYPYQQYSLVVADPNTPLCTEEVAVANAENTLAIFCPSSVEIDTTLLAHELAHQWFGLSVVPATLQDSWLAEGPATYAQWLWESRGEPGEELDWIAKNQQAAYRQYYSLTSTIGNPPDRVISMGIYTGGALLLHSLRREVGDEAFFDILQAFLSRYRYTNASTSDFIDIANEISGRDLNEFFDSWLYQTDLPPVIPNEKPRQ